MNAINGLERISFLWVMEELDGSLQQLGDKRRSQLEKTRTSELVQRSKGTQGGLKILNQAALRPS